jgi:hypothetical protein
MSEKSRRKSALQQAMRNILPEEKHIGVLFDLTGPLGTSPEYDRAAAIISTTFLEYGLKKCIKTHLKPDPSDPDFTYLFSQDDAPYRDFGTLIRLARALAVIRPSDYGHLETIRRIRNAFAHSMDHSLSFDHPNVSGAIESLIRPDEDWFDSVSSIFTDKEDVALGVIFGRRRIFIHAVFAYYWHLLIYDPRRGYAAPLLDFMRTTEK